MAIRGSKHSVCGLVVEITNLRTKRAVFAPVVDIGPCMSGNCPERVRSRVADLLTPVRDAIGGGGLTRVKLRIVTPANALVAGR